MRKQLKTGKVIFAGAGPGDPELITMKAVRYLQNADLILADRLVSHEILNEFANEDADIITVGKQCRTGISTPQEAINHLMVQHASQGKLVVRLKGGDVSVFSNIKDELDALTVNGIPYQIIPGVTAALGASAYAGIPLTARGYATSVRFLTYYKSTVISDEYWKELAKTNDTLVFYMSSETLSELVEKLTANHIDENKLLAIIEQATTPLQNVHVCSPYDYEINFKNRAFISPSLIVIGKVVSLHRKFHWLENSNSDKYYFEPMDAQKIALNQPKIKLENVS
jgi:uroporphyrin-III C-methyltransferase/precorrin-2 dehydrogenase/sirohydrochlorin ferrochelatase/uroporphyrin-III C-methyltransferase